MSAETATDPRSKVAALPEPGRSARPAGFPRKETPTGRTQRRLLMDTTPRRGWRQRLETGIYRRHRLACPSSRDHRTGRRCDCPYEVAAPTGTGRTRWLTVAGSLPDARKARARAQASIGTVSAPRRGGTRRCARSRPAGCGRARPTCVRRRWRATTAPTAFASIRTSGTGRSGSSPGAACRSGSRRSSRPTPAAGRWSWPSARSARC